MKRISRLVLIILMAVFSAAVGQSLQVDTSQVAKPVDSVAVAGKSAAANETVVVPRRPRLIDITDSLLLLIFRGYVNNPSFPDRTQANTQWQNEPALYRLSVSPWGDFETFYPLGLPPTYLSRVDNLAGEQSFANPVPIPYGEDFVRVEPAERFQFLTPALSGLVLPLGGVSSIYQQSDLDDFDTASSSIYVHRARGGFANTTFDFKSNFGKFGAIRSDGTFQKIDGLVSGANTNLRRMRFILEPRLRPELQARILYSINRLNGAKLFFPEAFDYTGNVTDNLSTLATSVTLVQSEHSQYDLRLSYRNDDQRFNQRELKTAQRWRVLDSQLSYQRRSERSVFSLGGAAKYLHFLSQGQMTNSIYYEAGLRQLTSLGPRLSVFGTAAVVGSDDFAPSPLVVGAIITELTDKSSLAAIAGWRGIIPSAELMFSETISASLADSVVDYRLQSDHNVGAGKSRSLELVYNRRSDRSTIQMMAGMMKLDDIAEWQIESDSIYVADVSVVERDRSVFYGTLKTNLTISSRVSANLGYGVRSVRGAGDNVTFGAMHTAHGSAYYHFPINKLKLWLNVGVGAAFRSAADRYLLGGPEDGVIVAETYFSFDLKRFHLYFNYHNLLGVDYTLNGIQQPGRSVWWGFSWAFID